ncbi:MAG: HAD-IA family hydrolase [Corynebacterium sp.]|nr:HAD-IA family hydrolase [Corynebacterium sp.]
MPGTQPALLFDLYGVLIRHRKDEDRRAVEASLGLPAEKRQVFWDAYHELRAPLDKGEVTDYVWWQEVAASADLPELNIDAAIQSETATLLRPHEESVAMVRELIAEGWRIGVLSNIPHILGNGLKDKHTWFQEFHSVTYSCDIGEVKPEPAAYEVALHDLGSEAANTIFFDDTLANVTAAEEFGLQAVHYTEPADIARAVAPWRS